MRKKKRKRLVKEIEFKLKDNQSLVICYGLLPIAGLERVIVENKNGITHIFAEGRSRFEFHEGKNNPNECDFFLDNPKTCLMLEDIINSKFYSQFNWGKLFSLQENKELNKKITQEIKKLVKEFEEKTSTQLNKLYKEQSKQKNKKRG